NLKLADFPEIQSTATSLADELGGEVSRLEVVRSLLVEMDGLYLSAASGGFIYEQWRDKMITLGRQVRVTEGGTSYEGVAESVATDGSLLLRAGDGKLTRIVAGDVTLSD
ncbi:MAG: biotin--[acetyl-CoA-carboxylase] ligase, partial [Dehalococcoidales bacterium]